MSEFKVTPQMVDGILQVVALGFQFARDRAAKAGMTEAEFAARWDEAKVHNDQDLQSFIEQMGGTFPTPMTTPPTPEPPAEEPPTPPAAIYGATLDAQPDDATLRSGSQVFYRGDGKWFVWTIGVFVDPEALGFSLHHIVP